MENLQNAAAIWFPYFMLILAVMVNRSFYFFEVLFRLSWENSVLWIGILKKSDGGEKKNQAIKSTLRSESRDPNPSGRNFRCGRLDFLWFHVIRVGRRNGIAGGALLFLLLFFHALNRTGGSISWKKYCMRSTGEPSLSRVTVCWHLSVFVRRSHRMLQQRPRVILSVL